MNSVQLLVVDDNPANRLPHTAPPKYDPAQYELLARYLEALTAKDKEDVRTA